MNKMKKVFASVLTTGMLFSATVVPTFAEEYTYTVTVSTGNHTVDGYGSGQIASSSVAYGDSYSFDIIGAVTDDGYRVTGVKRAGTDSIEGKLSAFTVEEDTDLVLTYEKVDAEHTVSYVVQYHDADGNELLPDQVLTGNEGSTPIIPYKAIDGYIPQAYNLTTSSLSEGKVFEFKYTPDTTTNTVVEETTTTETVVTPTQGNQGTQGNEGTQGNQGGQGNQGTQGDQGNQGDQGTQGNQGNQGDQAGQGNQGDQGQGGENTPQDIVNVDDEDTPLAGGDEDTDTTKSSISPVMIGGIAAVILILVGIVLSRRKKA